ncbi:hypothetical protein [Sulfurimonas sp.]|nr:hypothetical protein [Sulfurimonas sp.]MCW8895278.1 hypothetical protein [Sulfurimonas sp.]
MIQTKKVLTVLAIGFFLIAIVGCSDHGHSHDKDGGHTPTKHETIG